MIKFLKRTLRRSTKFPYIHIRQRSKASLVIVKDLSSRCKTEAEQKLYQQLRARLYYPTPNYYVQGVLISLALVPFKLAFIESHPGINQSRISRQLRKKGWQVVYYDAESLLHDENRYVNKLLQAAPQPIKNVSS
ncbi:hypothetical protein M3202_13320 [Alkalihalobacillus oceani]|uniref:Uncharacterized protein n=1 Tax=Halalkalibacter oceani TaxID=1653776 RepID=A0A9X2DT90_9BACI|nr:hypothetical protein [Halalkalibacter oceani]MCM3715062.1 hypothetical protein [Halalkalibacter oceani]